MDVQANHTTLYAEQTGDGPSLVFVHGMCGDGRVWAGQVDRLGDQFRCTTYDRRGHTRSPRTDAVQTVELHAGQPEHHLDTPTPQAVDEQLAAGEGRGVSGHARCRGQSPM